MYLHISKCSIENPVTKMGIEDLFLLEKSMDKLNGS